MQSTQPGEFVVVSDLADLIRETVPDWSNRRIAKVADVAPGTIDGIMRGDRTPAVDTLDKIAHALKLPVERVREAAGQPRGEAAPYTPPSEANLLDDRQRRAIDELIRSFIETRGAPDVDQSATAPAAPEGTPDTPSEDVKKIYVLAARPADGHLVVHEETVYAESLDEARNLWDRALGLAHVSTARNPTVKPFVALTAETSAGPIYYEFVAADDEAAFDRANEKLYLIMQNAAAAALTEYANRQVAQLADRRRKAPALPDLESLSGAARRTGQRKGSDPRGLDDGEE